MAVPMTSSVDKLPLKTNDNDTTDDIIVKEIIDYVKDDNVTNVNSQQNTSHVPLNPNNGTHGLSTLPPQSSTSTSLIGDYIDVNVMIVCGIIVLAVVIIQNTDFLKTFVEYSNVDMFKENPLYLQYGVIFIVTYIIQKNNIYK